MDQAKRKTDFVTEVVAAFASRPNVSPDEIVELASKLVAWQSDQTGAVTVEPPTRPGTPAIPLEKAVTPDRVFCLVCGKGFTMLKRHLSAEHGLTEQAYRRMFSLPEEFPLVAPNYSDRKAKYAKRAGLGKYQRQVAGRED